MIKKLSVTLEQADIDAAKVRLLEFFVVMSAWEKFARANFDKGHKKEIPAKVKALYQKYATERHHDQD